MQRKPSTLFISNFHNELKQDMSSFPAQIISRDGDVSFQERDDTYFLDNNKWGLDKIRGVNQFKLMVDSSPTIRKNIKFQLEEPSLNLEVKYIFFNRLFNNQWKLTTMFQSIQNPIRRLTEFINENKKGLMSFLHLNINEDEKEYIDWLQKKGLKTKRLKRRQPPHNDVVFHTSVASIMRVVYSELAKFAKLEQPKPRRIPKQREEWKKDRWDVRNLYKVYGIEYNKTISEYTIDFSRIEIPRIRNEVKNYFKQRLLSKHKFAWGTAKNYITTLTRFFHFLHKLEPNWKNIKGLKRNHIVKFIEYLHAYITNPKGGKSNNPEALVAKNLVIIEKFLSDMQRYGYKIAPRIDVRNLLFPEDIPRQKRKSIHQIDFIPDFVLKQLFKHIHDLRPDVRAVIMIAFKTGLRISDILTLKSDCIIKLDNQYWLEANIRKSKIKGHRIPIDHHLVRIVESIIEINKSYFNPEGYLFVKTKGPRKGQTINQTYIRAHLGELAKRNQIKDESERLFHFRTHQFRHTFALKMLSGGADLLTVQDIMAHRSPEATLSYVRVLDETKREVFDSVVQNGEFDFEFEEKYGCDSLAPN
ncbi:tyrosine-type recombinase/integrase [Aquibacillus koreensis]|uniref:Tyrosine-type recombinase/integrase n=1 Tax=Aquibacillus koreensis TaxID=279446 RepID=A0A9X3WJN2_9BACI|nr:tyrosine-type recombinase/integrase [Aquibacillus koreensis]MCT2534654.1 tyrosine-type recombinase/integrase [Aquibacillus koreensis]MDC3419838.1 tyrosine-type recombinase/integrase [Aquibacillus koreensis]